MHGHNILHSLHFDSPKESMREGEKECVWERECVCVFLSVCVRKSVCMFERVESGREGEIKDFCSWVKYQIISDSKSVYCSVMALTEAQLFAQKETQREREVCVCEQGCVWVKKIEKSGQQKKGHIKMTEFVWVKAKKDLNCLQMIFSTNTCHLSQLVMQLHRTKVKNEK